LGEYVVTRSSPAVIELHERWRAEPLPESAKPIDVDQRETGNIASIDSLAGAEVPPDVIEMGAEPGRPRAVTTTRARPR
jgi:hypothetical protein